MATYEAIPRQIQCLTLLNVTLRRINKVTFYLILSLLCFSITVEEIKIQIKQVKVSIFLPSALQEKLEDSLKLTSITAET